jgi:hypothetical protein
MGPTTRASFFASWWALFSTWWYSPLTSSSHGLEFPEKMMWQTDWVYLTSQRFLKLKNMQK